MTRVDELTGRLVRQCLKCRQWKDLVTEFHLRHKRADIDKPPEQRRYRARCRDCQIVDRRRQYQNGEQMGRVPVGPLVDAIDRLVRQRAVWDARPDYETVCRSLGIDPRNLYGWRSGERLRIKFDVADRILTRSEWLWFDIWNETTVPDPAELARIAVLFEGEQAEVAA